MANLSYKPYIPVYWNPVIYPWHLTFWIFIQSIALRWESKAYSLDRPFWACGLIPSSIALIPFNQGL